MGFSPLRIDGAVFFLMVLHGLHGTYGELTDRTEDLTSKHWDVRDTSINNTNYEIWIDLLHK